MLAKYKKESHTHRSKANLPSPSNISFLWNFGSLLGMTLVIQMLTGTLLAAHYTTGTQNAFQSIVHISRDTNLGWLLQNTHANGASMFFILLYLHIARGLYHGSYLYKKTWMAGIALLLLTMLTAFAGYILPWGQMSFWAATVITNLISAIPYIGTTLVEWIWGGFSVDSPTLNRIFALHFAAPFIIAATAMVHMMLLHESGSNNPTGLNSNTDKVPFHPYFTYKDILGAIWAIALLFTVTLLLPDLFSEPENFIPADPLTTPTHIKPEWYFLFAYAILRAVPNKLGGVLALAASIMVLALFPTLHMSNQQSMAFRPITQFMFWTFISTVIILTWIGGRSADYPLTDIGQVAALAYFTTIVLMFPTITWLENKF